MAAVKLARKITQRLKTIFSDSKGAFSPYIPRSVNRTRLVSQVADFFCISENSLRTQAQKYWEFVEVNRYDERLGEIKTFSSEEAFVAFAVINYFAPTRIVEIGTQFGKSARRLVDLANWLDLDSEIVCYDIEDLRKYVTDKEAQLILKDLTGSFKEDVLVNYEPGLIFLDAHPYYLIKEIVEETIAHGEDCILLIHDCSAGLCNPDMTISEDEPELITSRTGVWERHILAEIFEVEDPLSTELDNLRTDTHWLRIFDTQHGLAAIRSLDQRLIDN